MSITKIQTIAMPAIDTTSLEAVTGGFETRKERLTRQWNESQWNAHLDGGAENLAVGQEIGFGRRPASNPVPRVWNPPGVSSQ